MSKDQVFINDEEMDISPGTIIGIKSQINNLGDMEDRQARQSNQFKLPKTAANFRKLQQAGLISSTSALPYRKNVAKQLKEGLEMIPNGFAILESTDQFYNLTISSAIIDLMERLQEKKLSDLDLSVWDHVMDRSTMAISRVNDDGYIYTIVDYNNNSAYCSDGDLIINVTRNPPMMFVHTIIEKIFEEAGVAFEGNIFNRDKYKRMLLQLGTDGFNHSDKWVEDNKVKAYCTTPVTIVWADVLRFLPFDDDNVQGYDPAGLWNGTIHFDKRNVKAKFKLHLDLTINSGSVAIEIRFGIPTVAYTFPSVTASGVYEWESPELVTPSSVDTGFWANQPGATDSFTLNPGSWMEVEYIKTNVYGTDIQISGVMPDMTQKEFVKSILAHLYGAMPSIDPFTGVYRVVTFQEIIDRIPFANKWEDKLHMDKRTWKEEYRIGSYAQRNWLKYSEAEGVTKGLGDGYFDIDDQVLEKETTLFTLPFAATDWVQRFGNGRKIPLIQLWDSDGNNITTKPRILLLDREEPTPGPPFINYSDGVGGFTPVNSFMPYCHFIHPNFTENLGFGNNMMEKEYPGLIRTLQRLKVFEAPFYLSSLEMHNMDHYTPVYVPELTSHFYINVIPSFTATGKTRAQLIRLGEGNICVPEYGPEILLDGNFPSPNVYWAESGLGTGSVTYGVPGFNKSGLAVALTQFFSDQISPVGKFLTEITIIGQTQGEVYVSTGVADTLHRVASGDYKQVLPHTGVLNQFIVYTDDDFDGVVTLASLKPQLTCA